MAIRIFQSFLVVYPCLKIPAFVRSPSVNCSFLSFFSLFLWFWKLVLEKRWSVGFLFHCPPLYVPFIKPEDASVSLRRNRGTMVCYPGVSRFSPAQDEEDGNKGMMGCWLCLPKPWFCFFFPRPFRVSLSWSLSLSTPYLFPCLFFFVPVL